MKWAIIIGSAAASTVLALVIYRKLRKPTLAEELGAQFGKLVGTTGSGAAIFKDPSTGKTTIVHGGAPKAPVH